MRICASPSRRKTGAPLRYDARRQRWERGRGDSRRKTGAPLRYDPGWGRDL